MHDPTEAPLSTAADSDSDLAPPGCADPAADLGPLAYGLFVLSEPGPLAEIPSLAEGRAAQLPHQGVSAPEWDLQQEKLLGELGALDL